MGLLSKLFNLNIVNTGKTSVSPKNVTEKETTLFSEKDMEQFILPYEIPKFNSHVSNKKNLSNNNQIQAINDISLINNFLDYAYKNNYIKIKYSIPINNICFNSTNTDCSKLVFQPYTRTGKKSKYPLVLDYKTKGCYDYNPNFAYWGEISYMQDGNIGKVRAICWIKHDMCVLNLGLIGSTLSIKSVEINNKKTGEKIITYKV